MKINLVVAASNNDAIGKDNKLLWHLPNDLKMFKNLTSKKVVVMGRKTYESIGKPLPNRLNVIITKNKNYKNDTALGCIIADSVENAIKLIESIDGSKEAFIIGGGTIYKQVLEMGMIDEIYLTKVDCEIEDADTFFEFDESKWVSISEEKHTKDDRHFTDYEFIKYKKI
jgi:dihydrofolate reductase